MRGLLVVCFVIGIAAVAAPNIFAHYLAPAAVSTADASHPPSADQQAEAAVESQKHGHAQPRQIEIKAERDGHFYVDAQVNFRPVRLMVDTGATVVALRASDAAEAGIRVNDADFTEPVQTANGTAKAAQAMLEVVSVNDLEVRNVRALIIPDDQLSISLLGGSFLHGLGRFEVADGTLIFED